MSPHRPAVSLLHATYRAGDAAVLARDEWLRRARRPQEVEHVFAYAADDEISAAMVRTTGARAVETPHSQGLVTAVANWNAAARVATGAILVVVADDLVPPACWDDMLAESIGRLDPLRDRFGVKVTDGGVFDPGWTRPIWLLHLNLLRHPVVSRAYYERHGLFEPSFRGVYCDNDITLRAFTRAVVVNAKRLVLEHKPGRFTGKKDLTESQARINASEEYAYGRSRMRALWPWHRWRGACICLPRAFARSGSRPLLWTHQTVALALGPALHGAFALRNRILRRMD